MKPLTSEGRRVGAAQSSTGRIRTYLLLGGKLVSTSIDKSNGQLIEHATCHPPETRLLRSRSRKNGLNMTGETSGFVVDSRDLELIIRTRHSVVHLVRLRRVAEGLWLLSAEHR